MEIVPRMEPEAQRRSAGTSFVVIVVLLSVVPAAWTWPLGHDEALTWDWFVTRSWSVVFTSYDANHHVLFTILSKLARAVFGDAEWALRLPSVIAAVVFVVAAERLVRTLPGGAVFRFGTLALATSTPLTIDYLIAARGYAGALACTVVALVALRRHAGGRRCAVAIGLALGGAVAFNLAFVYPVAGIALAAFALRVLDVRAFVVAAAVAIALVAAICGGPLAHASSGAFYFGARSWGETVDSLYMEPLRTDSGLLLYFLTFGKFTEHFGAACIVMRVVIGLALIGVIVDLVRRWPARDARDATRIPGLALCIGIALVIAANVAADVPLPKGRTALWMSALLPFALAPSLCGAGRLRREARGSVALIAVVVALPFFHGARDNYFAEWPADKVAPGSIAAIALDASDSPGPVHVWADWRLAPSLKYYALRRPGAPELDVRRVDLKAPLPSDGPRPDYWVVLHGAPESRAVGERAKLVKLIGWTALLRE